MVIWVSLKAKVESGKPQWKG